jgi:hypothetical protein
MRQCSKKIYLEKVFQGYFNSIGSGYDFIFFAKNGGDIQDG